MSIARLIASMKAAGCSAEQIGVAALAYCDGDARSPAAERQARYRARKKEAQTVTGDVTRDASLSQPVPPEVSPKDNNQTPFLPPSRIEEPQARGKRLAEDWRPSDASWQVAAVAGLNRDQTETVITEFKNYWLSEAGQKARKVSWDRTFQNRVTEVAPKILRSAARDGPRALPLGRNGKPSVQDFARLLDERINGTHGDMFSEDRSEGAPRPARLLSAR